MMKNTKTYGSSKVSCEVVNKAPKFLLGVLLIFVFFALVIGEVFNAYEKFWWWDDMLHTVSGVVVGLVGFLMVYFFNGRYNMRISPLFVAVFAFIFAITIGVLWEIVEFTIDALFHADMQRWNLPPDSVLMGKAFQGSGLRDTMSDLILAWLGATATSVFAYFAYKHERPTVLSVMRRTFPFRAKQKKKRKA